MKTYIVQLEAHDDVISTKDKISWSKATRVLLVWPKKGKALDRRIDLLLLQRACHQMGVQMGIVTRSSEVKAYARDLGIPVFNSSVKAQTTSWIRRKRRSILETISNHGRVRRSPTQLREQLNLLRSGTTLAWLDQRLVRIASFIIAILAFLALALFFVPGARVELKPQRQVQSLTIPVWASPQIHAPNPSGGIPAYPLSAVIEGRDQAGSTGQVKIADRPAAGEITLTNLTDQVVEVPADSVVLTLTNPPVRFQLINAVTLPAGAGKTTTASIRAALPGSSGVVAAGQIRAMEGSVGLRLTVDNPQPTQGGSDRTTAAPSLADYQALKQKLLAALQASAAEELRSRLKPGQQLLEPSLKVSKVIEESQEPKVNQPADRFELALRVEFTAWYIEDADLRAVSQSALNANQAKGFQPMTNSLAIAFDRPPEWVEKAEEGSAAPENSVLWTLKTEQTLEAKWSREQALQAIQGRPLNDALLALKNSIPLADAPRIELFPAWWGRLPFLPFRIQVVNS